MSHPVLDNPVLRKRLNEAADKALDEWSHTNESIKNSPEMKILYSIKEQIEERLLNIAKIINEPHANHEGEI